MSPPHQGLHPDDLTRLIDLRLVFEEKLLFGQGHAKVRLHLSDLSGMGLHLGIEEDAGTATLLLGLVDGQIGEFEEVVGRAVRVGKQGHAHTGGGDVGLTIDFKGGVKDLADLVEHMLHLLGGDAGLFAEVVEQQDKLVAGQPGQGVLTAAVCSQPLGHQPQQLIAFVVAHGVVQ